MNATSSVRTRYALNSHIVSSIKSPDSLSISGLGTPFELPFDFFQLLMVFAEPKAVDEAFQLVDVDVDSDEFERIVRDFITCGLLIPDRHEDDDTYDLRQFLSPRVFDDITVINRIGAAMREGRAVLIPDALRADFAEEVHRELCQSNHWAVIEGGHGFFHYRKNAIGHLEHRSPALARCSRLFGSNETRHFIGELSGEDCTGEVSVSASWYRPNEYALPHDDSYATAPRSVAYIWYLTRDWQREWGGSLFWCPTGQYVNPRFNMLLMFRVMPSNVHFICPVSASATARRLAISGFWHRSQRAKLSLSIPSDDFVSPRAYGPLAPDGATQGSIIVL